MKGTYSQRTAPYVEAESVNARRAELVGHGTSQGMARPLRLEFAGAPYRVTCL
jgi:hypothetical protein